jgi:monoamine oxidase
MIQISRRQALQTLASLPLGAALSCNSGPPAGRPRVETLVIGAGVCGLTLARNLRQRGRSVVILEASQRCGGRVRTLRSKFTPGLRAEAGAERIAGSHRATRRLLQELQLSTSPYPAADALCYQVAEQNYRLGGNDPLPHDWLHGLTDKEREFAPLDVHLAYIQRLHLPEPSDPRSGLQWLRDRGLSRAAEKLLRAFCLFPLTDMAAHDFCQAALRESEAWDAEVIDGGSDRLVEKLRDGLPECVHHGVTVSSIRQQHSQVLVEDLEGQSYSADWVVVALPLSCLRRIQFPGQNLAGAIARAQGTLVAHELKAHFEIGLSPQGPDLYWFRSQAPRVFWPLPEVVHGQRVMTTITTGGDVEVLREAGSSGRSALHRFLHQQLPELVAPGCAVDCYDFSADPLAGGAYAFAGPGATPRKASRDGQLLFAGSDLSAYPGWLEGAVQSAHAATELICSQAS